MHANQNVANVHLIQLYLNCGYNIITCAYNIITDANYYLPI
jgi:hypothetical protein